MSATRAAASFVVAIFVFSFLASFTFAAENQCDTSAKEFGNKDYSVKCTGCVRVNGINKLVGLNCVVDKTGKPDCKKDESGRQPPGFCKTKYCIEGKGCHDVNQIQTPQKGDPIPKTVDEIKARSAALSPRPPSAQGQGMQIPDLVPVTDDERSWMVDNGLTADARSNLYQQIAQLGEQADAARIAGDADTAARLELDRATLSGQFAEFNKLHPPTSGELQAAEQTDSAYLKELQRFQTEDTFSRPRGAGSATSDDQCGWFGFSCLAENAADLWGKLNLFNMGAQAAPSLNDGPPDPLRIIEGVPSTRYDPNSAAENAGTINRGKYSNEPIIDPKTGQPTQVAILPQSGLQQGAIVDLCNGDKCTGPRVVGDGGGRVIDLANQDAKSIGCDNCRLTVKVLEEGFRTYSNNPTATYDRFPERFAQAAAWRSQTETYNKDLAFEPQSQGGYLSRIQSGSSFSQASLSGYSGEGGIPKSAFVDYAPNLYGYDYPDAQGFPSYAGGSLFVPQPDAGNYDFGRFSDSVADAGPNFFRHDYDSPSWMENLDIIGPYRIADSEQPTLETNIGLGSGRVGDLLYEKTPSTDAGFVGAGLGEETPPDLSSGGEPGQSVNRSNSSISSASAEIAGGVVPPGNDATSIDEWLKENGKPWTTKIERTTDFSLVAKPGEKYIGSAEQNARLLALYKRENFELYNPATESVAAYRAFEQQMNQQTAQENNGPVLVRDLPYVQEEGGAYAANYFKQRTELGIGGREASDLSSGGEQRPPISETAEPLAQQTRETADDAPPKTEAPKTTTAPAPQPEPKKPVSVEAKALAILKKLENQNQPEEVFRKLKAQAVQQAYVIAKLYPYDFYARMAPGYISGLNREDFTPKNIQIVRNYIISLQRSKQTK